jgi:hypothetical protein
MNRCNNCGGAEVEVGEGGAPSKCARCGSLSICYESQTSLPSAVLTPPQVKPERAAELFKAMHQKIDGANAERSNPAPKI